MNWSDEEKRKLEAREHATGRQSWKAMDRAVYVADLAVELVAARGGTMTAPVLEMVLGDMAGEFGNGVDRIRAHLAAQGARVAVLEKKRDGAQTLQAAQRDSALREVKALRSELAGARATIARLTAAGQALSEHAEKGGGPGQCANPGTRSPAPRAPNAGARARRASTRR
jgi:hypothetical protein